MDNLSYLNQISMENSPKKSEESFLESKKFKLFLIISGALIIICIIFGIISSLTNRETDFVPRLNLRVSNVSKIISTYNTKVKSSSLRAAGASLSSILDNMSSTLPIYIDKEYEMPEKVEKEETEISTDITIALDKAKINGYLDRSYASQLAYAVSILLSLCEEASNNSDVQQIKTFLASTMESLNTIYPAFSDFSDATK